LDLLVNSFKQTITIDDADILINGVGTAPGLFWSNPKGHYGSHIILLPGVPKEMKNIWEQQVSDKLKNIAGKSIHTKRMVFWLFSEDIVCERTKQIREKYSNVNWVILANSKYVEILGRSLDLASLEAACMELQVEIGLDVAFVSDSGGVENLVVTLLAKFQHTLSIAESITGGSLAACLTAIPNVSEVFLGGAVVYSAKAKTILTNIDVNLIEIHGTVSRPVTSELALAIRKLLGTTWGLAITGNAGPNEDKDGPAPIGTCFIAIAGPDGVECEKIIIYGDRAAVQARSVTLALGMLRRRLLKMK
jgi:nicotinamide-nucleotide amidase